MPIHLPHNPFAGVNPHLNSAMQTPGTPDAASRFPGYHLALIGETARHLNQQLPARYIAVVEEALQLRGEDTPPLIYRPRPDLAIFGTPSGAGRAAPLTTASPTWEAALEEGPELVPLRAVRVREIENGALGRLVASFEVLSPSNKPDGAHGAQYRDKRAAFIALGIPLIEIDLLHEGRPIIPALPVYPGEAGAYPFTILVSDPRPDQRRARAYGAAVDERLPRLALPLFDPDAVEIDFDAIYQRVFLDFRYAMFCDYAREPDRFSTYSAGDQAVIRARVAELAAQHAAEN